MDAWDDDFREPTEDERSARRVLALAIAFINARRPLSSTELHREFYPEASDATFRKTFLRDRERLAMAGMVLRKEAPVDDIATWSVDEDCSFVRENLLTKEDALALDLMLLPLASDPSYPYARDLRVALAKIDHSFDGTSQAAIPPEARRRNNNISRLEDCMVARHAARIVYLRADGTRTERTIAPLGFFFLNGSTYMVASRIGDRLGEDSPHTYNLGRVVSVREQKKASYTIPADFDIRDFVLLPFQMGPRSYDASFATDDGSVRSEWVSDECIAASWAIAEGLTPIEPASLVEEWRQQLEAAAKGSNHAIS